MTVVRKRESKMTNAEKDTWNLRAAREIPYQYGSSHA
jgi:hypothetical protein